MSPGIAREGLLRRLWQANRACCPRPACTSSWADNPLHDRRGHQVSTRFTRGGDANVFRTGSLCRSEALPRGEELSAWHSMPPSATTTQPAYIEKMSDDAKIDSILTLA